MRCVVIGIHDLDCFTYIVDEQRGALLKIKEELSFKLKAAENIDGYIRGLSNGLHREVFDDFDVLIIYFDPQRMSVAFQTADRLSDKGCRYVSVSAAARALIPVSEELLKRDNCFELWEILGKLYQVKCYKGELSLAAVTDQRRQATRTVTAGEMCFFTSSKGGIGADDHEHLKRVACSLWEKFNSENNPLLDEIYVLMGMAGEMKSHRQLLKRLSSAYALYRIPEEERSDITARKLTELASDRTNPYSHLIRMLNMEMESICDVFHKAKGNKGFSAEELITVKKEIRDYVTLNALRETGYLQKIKDDIISNKLGDIWREREQYA